MFLSKDTVQRLFRRKRGAWAEAPNAHDESHSLFDLLCIGVGATAGSGVFVLTGMVANLYAGPAVVISWVLAGLACLFSALSFAELSAAIPSPGSAYTFVYCTLGELPAYLAACCLSLECGISGAAVARNWGVKLQSFLHGERQSVVDEGLNFYAATLMLLSVLLFLAGTEASKLTINIFTVLKILLITFMIVCGLSLFSFDNIRNFTPYGVSGVFHGATSCFFGFVGYDEVCCMALETKDPVKALPRAVFGTIFIVSVLYALSSIALVGMTPYSQVDPQSGFAMAFYSHGWIVAGDITALGELLSLPLVVVVSFLPQARILYAMAKDRLVPEVFLRRDSRGTLREGVLWCGSVCVLIALLVPFSALDDLISAGVLCSFILTNCALVLMRLDDEVTHIGGLTQRLSGSHNALSGLSPTDAHNDSHTHTLWSQLSPCKRLLLAYNIAALVVAASLTYSFHALSSAGITGVSLIGLALLVFIAVTLRRRCPDLIVGDDNDDGNDSVDVSPSTSSHASPLKIVSRERERERDNEEGIGRLSCDGEGVGDESFVFEGEGEAEEVTLRGDVVEIQLVRRYDSLPHDDDTEKEREKERERERVRELEAREREKERKPLTPLTRRPSRRLAFSLNRDIYRVPGVPYTPLIGIFINYFLVCQLTMYGLSLLFAYFAIAIVLYVGYTRPCRRASSYVEVPRESVELSYGTVNPIASIQHHAVQQHQ